MSRSSFVRGALILAVAGFSVRFLGAGLRILLAALIGDEGIGLYQMAYPVYSTLLAISTAGVPIAISKLVAEKIALNDFRGAYQVFRVALGILAFSGLFISGVLYLGADFFSQTVTKDPRAYYPLVSISPAIFLVTVMSALRGFFQGQQQMMPTALSQIFEQMGRVAVALILVVVLLPRGLEFAAAGATFGAVAGAFFGLLTLVYLYCRRRPFLLHQLQRQSLYRPQKPREIVYQIVALSLPVTLGSLVMPVITVIDLTVVPLRLHNAGFDTERATALYGQLTGMATSIVHFPALITVALAMSLVPAISEANVLHNMALIRARTDTAVRLTLLLAIPSAAGLYILAEPICVLLFNNAEAGYSLALLSWGVIFLSLYNTTAGILQGLGRTMIPVKSMFYGALVKTVLSWFLTSLPFLHVGGAAIASVAGFLLAAVMNLRQVSALSGWFLRKGELIARPMLAVLVMLAGVVFISNLTMALLQGHFGERIVSLLVTLGGISVGVVLYSAMLFVTGSIKEEDLHMIPRFGSRLIAVADKLHLLRR